MLLTMVGTINVSAATDDGVFAFNCRTALNTSTTSEKRESMESFPGYYVFWLQNQISSDNNIDTSSASQVHPRRLGLSGVHFLWQIFYSVK